MIAIKELFRDDMATCDKAKGLLIIGGFDFPKHGIDPWTCRIDDAFGGNGFGFAIVFDVGGIAFALRIDADNFGACPNVCTAVRRI